MGNRFYKVRCVDPNLTGQIGKYVFTKGQSYWLTDRRSRHALGSGAACPVPGPNDPYFAIMEFDDNPGWPDEATALAVSGEWSPPPGWRLVGEPILPAPPKEEPKPKAKEEPKHKPAAQGRKR